jgi:hypothetical protein
MIAVLLIALSGFAYAGGKITLTCYGTLEKPSQILPPPSTDMYPFTEG